MAIDAPAMAPLLKSGKKFAFLIENFCGLLGKCDNLTSSTGKDSSDSRRAMVYRISFPRRDNIRRHPGVIDPLLIFEFRCFMKVIKI